MEYQLLIGGSMVDGAGTMEVINPASGAAFAQCPRADAAQLEQAVAAARAAQPGWAARSWEERRAVLIAIAEGIEAQAMETRGC